eukprot:5235413-Alexandrium_andersonii.AAC.1
MDTSPRQRWSRPILVQEDDSAAIHESAARSAIKQCHRLRCVADAVRATKSGQPADWARPARGGRLKRPLGLTRART